LKSHALQEMNINITMEMDINITKFITTDHRIFMHYICYALYIFIDLL